MWVPLRKGLPITNATSYCSKGDEDIGFDNEVDAIIVYSVGSCSVNATYQIKSVSHAC